MGAAKAPTLIWSGHLTAKMTAFARHCAPAQTLHAQQVSLV